MNGYERSRGSSVRNGGRMIARSAMLIGCLILSGMVIMVPGSAPAAAAGMGPKQLWDRGNEYAASKLYGDAVGYYTGAIQKNKGEIPMADVARIFNSRGLAFLALKDPDRALSDFGNAMELDDRNPEFILNRGGVYLDLRKYERAIDDYSTALELNPRSAAAFAGRARGYQGSGVHDKAVADFAKLLEIEPNNAAALYGMGISYKASKQDEKAIEAFDRVLKIEPKNAGASYQKAGIYARSKKIDAACVWLDIAVGDGYRDWDALKNDPDFDALRKNPCYLKVIAGK